MRAVLIGIIAAVGLSTMATAGLKEEALQVVEQWAKAFSASDVDGTVGLHAPDALFIGTGSKAVVTDPKGIKGATVDCHAGAGAGDHARSSCAAAWWRGRGDG